MGVGQSYRTAASTKRLTAVCADGMEDMQGREFKGVFARKSQLSPERARRPFLAMCRRVKRFQ